MIERRTHQLFPPEERIAALERLEARMAPHVLFVSHQHHGAWKPDEPPLHYAQEWVTERGLIADRTPDGVTAARAARLVYTTG